MLPIWDDLKINIWGILKIWFFCLVVDQLWDLAVYRACDRYPNITMFVVHIVAMLVRGIILYLWFNIVKWRRCSWIIKPIYTISVMCLISIFHFSFVFNPKFPLHNLPITMIATRTVWTAAKEYWNWKSILEQGLRFFVTYLHGGVPLPSYELAPCTHVITGAVNVLLRCIDRLSGFNWFTKQFVTTCYSGIVSSAPVTDNVFKQWAGALTGDARVYNSHNCVQTSNLVITSFENYTGEIITLHVVAIGLCFYYYPTQVFLPLQRRAASAPFDAVAYAQYLWPDELRQRPTKPAPRPVPGNGPDMGGRSRARNVLHARGRSPGTLPARGRSPGTQV